MTDAQLIRFGIKSHDDRIRLPEDFVFADIDVGTRIIRINGLTDLGLLKQFSEPYYDALLHAMFRHYMRIQKHVMLQG